MKILRKILLIIIIIVAIPLLVAIFVDGDYSLEREIAINKNSYEVFDYLKYLKNHENFTVWSSYDPNMKKSYDGTDGTVGFIYSWESDNTNVGEGEQEIIKITPGKTIEYELRFYKPFSSTSPTYFKVEDIESYKTKVKWGFEGKMQYPLNLLLLFMNIEENLSEDFEEGLSNLKSIMETSSSYY